jgi:hypothetical protein
LLILDLFECQGKADIVYSASAADLRTKNTSRLEMMGIPGQNHAIRVEAQKALFVKVRAEMATLFWMPVNEQKEQGIGYYKYAIGSLGYSTSFNKILFTIGGLFKTRATNTTVESVKYTLYISNERKLLQQGLMCLKSAKGPLLEISVNSSEVGVNGPPEIVVEVEVSICVYAEKSSHGGF